MTGKSMRGENYVKCDYSGEKPESGMGLAYISECPTEAIWILGSKKRVNPTSRTHSPCATPSDRDLADAPECQATFLQVDHHVRNS